MHSDQEFKTRYLWMICLTAACGGLLFGYDWVVIGGAKPFYEVYLQIDKPALSGWVVSSALLGCMVGAPLSGVLSDRIGRKRSLIFAAILFLLSAAGTALAKDVTGFVLFRLLGGVGIGLAGTLSPMYIAEVSPPARRGRMVAINQLAIVIGILAAQLVNLLIAEPVTAAVGSAEELSSWNVQTGWRYMFGAELVPATLFFALMFFVPESPRWLCGKGDIEAASGILNKLGSDRYADRTLEEIRASLTNDRFRFDIGLFKSRQVLGLLLIGAVLPAYGQWSGINIIFNYAQEVFASVGFDVDNTLKTIVATGAVNLIFTLVALPLVDTFGRRRLMLLGAGGITITHALIALFLLSGFSGMPLVILFLSAIAIYAMTLGPVIWVLLSEIFPNRIRGFGMGFSTFVLWMSSFLLTYSFPLIESSFGVSGSFSLYGVISFLAFWFIFFHVKETKGKSLEELEAHLAVDSINPAMK